MKYILMKINLKIKIFFKKNFLIINQLNDKINIFYIIKLI